MVDSTTTRTRHRTGRGVYQSSPFSALTLPSRSNRVGTLGFAAARVESVTLIHSTTRGDVDPYDLQGSARTKSASDTTASIGKLELRTEKARMLARPDPGTATPQTSLRDALAEMRSHGGDAILIKENGRVAGILTERDVLKRVLGASVDESKPVAEFMTRDPHTLSADASLLDAMQAMESGHYRNVPLTEPDGTVVGLLRQQDLIEFIAEAFPQEILNLPPRPHQLMDQPEGA